MRKIFLIFLLFIISIFSVQASTLYVTPTGAGSNNGSDWNNALVGLPSNLTRGNTYVIAGSGTSYAAHTFSDAVSGTTMIIVRKAQSSIDASVAGWQSSFGSSQSAFSAPIIFHTGYILFDGAYRSNPTNGYGFKILNNGSTGENVWYGIAQDDFAWNCTNRYCEVQGSGVMSDSGPLDVGVLMWHSGHDNAFQYNWLHDVGASSFFIRNNTNTLIEYNFVNRNYSSAAQHAEGISVQIFTSNFIVRYNNFEDIEGTAFIASPGQSGSDTWTSSNWYIYGNTFGYSASNGGLPANQIMQGVSAVCFIFDIIIGGDFYFVNNTIYNFQQSSVSSGWTSLDARVVLGDGVTGLTMNTAYVENNLWYNSTNGGEIFQNGTITTHTFDYNYYGQVGVITDDNNHRQTTTINPLVNWQQHNFQLIGGTTSGVTLANVNANTFTIDPIGNARGLDGGWDRGAYEFVQNTSGTRLLTPTAKTGTVVF